MPLLPTAAFARAVALLKKYRDCCNNDLRAELEGTERNIDAVRRSFEQGVDFADVQRRVGELAGNGAGITVEQLSEILNFVSKGESIRDAVESRKPVKWTDQTTETRRVLKYPEDAQTHNKARCSKT